jgi:hypothetical protein
MEGRPECRFGMFASTISVTVLQPFKARMAATSP